MHAQQFCVKMHISREKSWIYRILFYKYFRKVLIFHKDMV